MVSWFSRCSHRGQSNTTMTKETPMARKKNKLSTSAKPLGIVELDGAEQAKANGGMVFGVIVNPHPPIFGIGPVHHPVWGVIINPKHHHKKPIFGIFPHP